nr:urease accessory UreF family protein [Jiella sonneratiae]
MLTLFTASFPIGGFAYSHGLEAAVREGAICCAEDAAGWVALLVARGSGWNDLVLMAAAHRALRAGSVGALAELGDLAAALAGSAERRAETRLLGDAFAAAARPFLAGTQMSDGAAGAGALPVVAGAVAAAAGLRLDHALTAYAHNFSSGLVSAAVRLVPLGQSEWVAVMAELRSSVASSAARASVSTLDDLGSSALVSEIAAMRHETLETRLFRS